MATFSFSNAFNRVDFPTFGRPRMATVPDFMPTHCLPDQLPGIHGTGAVFHNLIDGLAFADEAEPLSRQLFDTGRVALDPSDLRAKGCIVLLKIFDFRVEHVGSFPHVQILWKSTLVEEQRKDNGAAHQEANDEQEAAGSSLTPFQH